MIISTAVLGAALLLSGDIRLPAPLAPSILLADPSGPPAFVRPDADAPAYPARGVFVEDEDDDPDDKAEAQLAPSIAAFGVGACHALQSWLPRHGVFRASGRSAVLRC